MPSSAAHHHSLTSFPTRRSSDLRPAGCRRSARARTRRGRAADQRHRHHHARPRHRLRLPRGSRHRAHRRHPHRARHDGRHRAEPDRSEEHTSELQSLRHLVCRLLPPTTTPSRLSLHDALPISGLPVAVDRLVRALGVAVRPTNATDIITLGLGIAFGYLVGLATVRIGGIPIGLGTMGGIVPSPIDRKSTRLNSSHLGISYAVFCRPPPLPHVFPYTTLFRSPACRLPSIGSCAHSAWPCGRPTPPTSSRSASASPSATSWVSPPCASAASPSGSARWAASCRAR